MTVPSGRFLIALAFLFFGILLPLTVSAEAGSRIGIVIMHGKGGSPTKYALDGVIAIAPGGNAGSATYREKLGESVALARKFVAEGKGEDKTSLASRQPWMAD